MNLYELRQARFLHYDEKDAIFILNTPNNNEITTYQIFEDILGNMNPFLLSRNITNGNVVIFAFMSGTERFNFQPGTLYNIRYLVHRRDSDIILIPQEVELVDMTQ